MARNWAAFAAARAMRPRPAWNFCRPICRRAVRDGNGDIGPVADTVHEDARADKAALDRGVAGLK